MAQPNIQSLLLKILGRTLNSDVLVSVKGGQRFQGKLRGYDII
jgi:small nuclear ribonucleoprotein (snRNP)-like protein